MSRKLKCLCCKFKFEDPQRSLFLEPPVKNVVRPGAPPLAPSIKDPPAHLFEENRPNNPSRENLRVKAVEWMSRNPKLMREIEETALHYASRCKRFGIKYVIEHVRWLRKERGEGDDFKISNNHTAYIARYLADKHPEIRERLRFCKTRY